MTKDVSISLSEDEQQFLRSLGINTNDELIDHLIGNNGWNRFIHQLERDQQREGISNTCWIDKGA